VALERNIIKSDIMGQAPPPRPTLQDALIDMRINSKKLTRESNKAMKESQNYMKKAKDALKKNNEEGAKLYLQSAASKRTECNPTLTQQWPCNEWV
jgi:phage shock protein A